MIQAAFLLIVLSSIPLINFTPETTVGELKLLCL